jgi:60 kDa SS-A/Ro ribonucleoprotein
MTIFSKYFGRATGTPQGVPLPGMIANSAGGFTFQVDDWGRLDRFLVLGSEGGTYYISERALTLDGAEAVARCLAADGPRVVRRVVEISTAGRAPKNEPAIFVLAMAAKLGDEATRKGAYLALPAVCRTGTHLMHFAEYAQAFGGWGRGMRRAVASWFNQRPARDLAFQAVKYQARDGWSTRDLLRLAHPRAASPAHDRVFHWMVKGELSITGDGDPALALIEAFEAAKRATSVDEIVGLIAGAGLPREAVPTRWLTERAVWEALLPKMPMTALMRNLATMTKVGLLAPGGDATAAVATRLGDEAALRGARVHPVAVLSALATYRRGRGVRGDATWTPVPAIVDALDGAFYRSFGAVVPSGKRTLLALDVSGSMSQGVIAGAPGLSPRVGSAAMALITAATEEDHGFVAFTGTLKELRIAPTQRLDKVVKAVSELPFGPTDCAQPMLWAAKEGRAVDAFVVYTDSETWSGEIHPVEALHRYRQATGIPAKLIVVGMTSTGFTIADPDDAGMLDVVGFDTATPQVIADVVRA